MKISIGRLVVTASFVNLFALLGSGCIMPAGMGGYGLQYGRGFRQPIYGGYQSGYQQQVYQQPYSYQSGYQQQVYQQPPPQPIVMGNPQDTYQAAQRRAQQYAAGMNPPVSAYQNPYFPAGYVMGSGAPTWSPSQAWASGYTIP